jgi:hypothetical protein
VNFGAAIVTTAVTILVAIVETIITTDKRILQQGCRFTLADLTGIPNNDRYLDSSAVSIYIAVSYNLTYLIRSCFCAEPSYRLAPGNIDYPPPVPFIPPQPPQIIHVHHSNPIPSYSSANSPNQFPRRPISGGSFHPLTPVHTNSNFFGQETVDYPPQQRRKSSSSYARREHNPRRYSSTFSARPGLEPLLQGQGRHSRSTSVPYYEEQNIGASYRKEPANLDELDRERRVRRESQRAIRASQENVPGYQQY